MCICLHQNPVLCKAMRYGYSVGDDPIESCKCTCHTSIDIASGEDKTLNFYYCKGDGFHAVIEEQNEKFATEYFVYLMNELLEPEKGITIKDVACEAVNVYNYKAPRHDTPSEECPRCHGFCHVSGSGTVVMVCPDCNGTGKRK